MATNKYFVPLTELYLPDAVESFQIDRVRVISLEALLRRFADTPQIDWFLTSQGKPEWPLHFAYFESKRRLTEYRAMEIFEEEIYFLQCIQMPLPSGRVTSIAIIDGMLHYGRFCIKTLFDTGGHKSTQVAYPGGVAPLFLNRLADHALRDFRTILDAIRGRLPWCGDWRRRLRRVLATLGKSIVVQDVELSFLLAAIALESLLIVDKLKHREQLERGLQLLVCGLDEVENTERLRLFKIAYDKRCAFVHEGSTDGITLDDVRHLQALTYNCLIAIASNAGVLKSAGSVVDLASKLDAATVLGLQDNYRIPGLVYKTGFMYSSLPSPNAPRVVSVSVASRPEKEA